MKELFLIIAAVFLFNSINYSQSFTDIAPLNGMNTINQGPLGGGGSFYDFDMDGDDDVFVTSTHPDLFGSYMNTSGSFNSFTLPNINSMPNSVCIVWADYDNDGDKDVFISSWGTPCKLFRNDAGNFTDVTNTAGINTGNHHHSASAWGDYDNDGWLDLYITLFRGYGTTPFTIANYLYHNEQNGTFTLKSMQAGVADTVTQATGVSFLDYNNDGWQDIYVVSDKRRGNILYKNNGNSTFTDVTIQSNTRFIGDAMGLSVGDYNDDGFTDMYVCNGEEGNALYKNNGNGTFTDVAVTLGVAVYKVCWGTNFFDYDNDGDLDLYVCASSGAPNARNPLFSNNGDGTFTSLTNIGLNESQNSYGTATGDINNDGYLDMLVVNTYDPCNLYKNSGGTNNWIKIKLTGTASNRDGTGSKIEVFRSGQKFMRTVHNGISYLSQNSSVENYGVGSSTVIDSIIVEWPSGIRTVTANINVNQIVSISEDLIGIHGNGGKVPVVYDLFNNYPNPFNPSTKIEYSVPKLSFVNLSVFDILGREIAVLYRGYRQTGYYEADFSASMLPSGIYFYRLSTEGFSVTKKMMLVK